MRDLIQVRVMDRLECFVEKVPCDFDEVAEKYGLTAEGLATELSAFSDEKLLELYDELEQIVHDYD